MCQLNVLSETILGGMEITSEERHEIEGNCTEALKGKYVGQILPTANPNGY